MTNPGHRDCYMGNFKPKFLHQRSESEEQYFMSLTKEGAAGKPNRSPAEYQALGRKLD